IRPDPAESAELANAIAKRVPEVIKNLDEFNKAEGLERLKLEAEPYIKTEQDAKDALKKALADMKVNLEIEPGIDLNIYMTVPAVAEAKEYWDTVRETKIAFEFERYWQKITKPSLVTTKATPAPYFTGPEVQPFQMQFGLYGLTLGLFVGILLMAVCWKLLP
ncbi:hypothetical protein N9Z83_01595, partial [Akkermansiaceae bacterium]|nr:hypothetical protein [Akkermansiaceae bacterium]